MAPKAKSEAISNGTTEDYIPGRLLLTGGAGFIGSNVMVHLAKQYPDTFIVCLDSLEYNSNRRNFAELEDLANFMFVRGDITEVNLVAHLISHYQIDTIMHFAAETHVDQSFFNSLRFSQTNVIGTHVLLESTRLHGDQIKRFIHVSTDEVYGESQMDSERNTVKSALNPTNPYAATKAAAEFLVKSYRTSFDLPVIITRGNNVYGPKQFPEKLIPKFVSLLSQGKACPLHGDGSNRRSYLHVQDVAEAFDVVLRRGKIGEVYNIGSHQEYTNKQVLELLLEEFKIPDNERANYVTLVRDRAFNDFRYHIDTKPLEELGWKQKIVFKEGLKSTVQWYEQHAMHWKGTNLEIALQAHPEPHPSNFKAETKHAGPPAKKQKHK